MTGWLRHVRQLCAPFSTSAEQVCLPQGGWAASAAMVVRVRHLVWEPGCSLSTLGRPSTSRSAPSPNRSAWLQLEFELLLKCFQNTVDARNRNSILSSSPTKQIHANHVHVSYFSRETASEFSMVAKS